MATIDKLIFNALAEHRSVVLWGVGSLEVRRRKAKHLPGSRIIPPQNVVKFSTDEPSGVPSVVDMLVATGGADLNEARTLYESWLESARVGGGANRTGEQTIKIGGVGEIRDNKFVVARPLHTALNPEKEDIVTMKKENFGSWWTSPSVWAWVLVGVLAVALIFMVAVNYKQGLFGFGQGDDAPAVEVIEIIELPQVETPDDTAAQATADSIAAAESALAEAQAAAAVSTPAPAAPVAAPAPAPQPKKPAAPPVYRVIAGAFSIESNADNLIAKIRRDYPELKVEKVRNPRNGLNMVSIYSAPTERQAYNMMDKYWDIDLYLWIYKGN